MDYLGEAICLSLDALIFGICFKSYIRSKRTLKAVEGAPEVHISAKLEDLLKANDGSLSYVAIRGNVKALGPAIRSVNQPPISAVIQKLSIKEHVVSRSSSGFWSESQRTINEVFNSVPFVLVARAGQTEVEVVDALSSEILDLEVISDRFDPSQLGFMDHVWGFFTGVRKRGLQSIEEVLKEGAYVTAVGEIKNDHGILRIQPPASNTPPFFITTMPLHSLIRRLDEKATYCGWLSLGLGVIGVIIIGVMANKYWKKHQEWVRKEADRKRLESSRKDRRKGARDVDNLPEDKLCVVCKTNPKEIILLPCGHVCLCEDCSEYIPNSCPICKNYIESRNAAYIS